jgi:hypothetical protein
MDRLFFLHIPKTGGSSLATAMAKKFASWEIFPWQHSRIDLFPSAVLMPFRFFHGHFRITDRDYIPTPVQSVTVLREPRARILSLYNYWRSYKWEAIPRFEPHLASIAKSVGLRTFLTLQNPSLRPAFDNAMVQTYLPYPVRTRHGAFSASPETIIDDALAGLDSMTAFGMLERFADTVAVIGAALGSPLILPNDKVRSFELLPSTMAGVHEHSEYQGLTPEIESLLDACTDLDRLFYDRAVKLFDEKFGRVLHAAAPTADQRRRVQHEWGDWINFGMNFHLDGVELTGWSDQETWGVWSMTDRPVLRIGPLPQPTGETVRLTMSVRAAVFPAFPEQTITVMLDGEPVETWQFRIDTHSDKPVKMLHLPSAAVNEDGFLRLAFHIQRPVSLSSIGISADEREIGLGLENIHLECV